MKKAISLILSIIVCFSLYACGQSNPIIGTWEGEMLGIKMVYIFKEDGTFENYSDTFKGSPGTYTYNPDTKILELKNQNTTNNSNSVTTITIEGDTMIWTTSVGSISMDFVFKKTN